MNIYTESLIKIKHNIFKVNMNNKFLLFLIIFLLPIETCALNAIKNMPARNSYFTGRISYLHSMQKILTQYGKVYLTGYGGVGKTQLAKEFSYIHERDYDLIWWFNLNDNIESQYENLLTHLSNTKNFKKKLHINMKDLGPNVIVNFTNSLLSQSKCSWLLVFDNVSEDKDLKLPTINAARQHIIITTRNKQVIGNNSLDMGLFTNKESEQFLSKIHPKEKQKDIIELCKRLHNYPLALAQISEEILLCGGDIDSYLKKHDNFTVMKPNQMHSDLTQEYSNNYREVLNLILQDIEQKNKESAKTLYILSLLNVKLTKQLLKNLFGDDIDKNLTALSKHGVIEITPQNDSQVLSIHDIIIEEVVKRLNSKNRKYREEVIQILIKHCKSFYMKKDFKYFNELNAGDNQIATLYAFIDIALQNSVLDDEIIDVIITALRLNNMIFNKNANHDLYQKLADKIYSKNLAKITPIKKARLYASLVFLDSIFASGKNISEFEKEIHGLLNLIKQHQNPEELFYIYVNISLFYLFLGDFKETQKYIEKAKEILSQTDNIYNLLQYWYINAWLYYELRDIDNGIKSLDNYEQLNNNNILSLVGKLFARDLRGKFKALTRQKDVIKEINKAIQDALKYYDNNPSRILGELEYTKTLAYFQNNQYELAEKQAYHTLNILAKILGEDIIDLDQAHIYIILGKIAENKNNYNLALEKYKKALRFYAEKYYGKKNNFHEYGELLSSLCFIYYKKKNYCESKDYFRRLTSNFGIAHEIVDGLIKKLPHEYMLKVSNQT